MATDLLETAPEPRDPGGAPALLLATKLHAPAPRVLPVPRQRLFARLDDGAHTALSLVSAPAGFGKSTLVSDWLRQDGRASAWLSLDAGDSDLRRFLSYLVAALERPLPGIGRGLAPLLAAPRLADPEPLLTLLVNGLCETPGCILVLDDYHAITAPDVHQALAFLLERLPAAMHVVMTTRVDPPLPLPRLRARGLLCELRAEDLRFTSEEAAAFLHGVMGLDVAPAEVEALEQRTEGWIAGLQMAALSLRGRDDVSACIAGFTGSHRFVLDYLTEEVLDRQPADRLDFLLRTSILPRFCGPLCDAVLGRRDGQAVLESLETANLFLIPLDEIRGWYRYHHLFAGLLQDELRRRLSDAEVAELHARAADWLDERQLADEAVEHALAARDWERATRIISTYADAVMHQGNIGMAARWLDALPEECYQLRPRLLLDRGIMLFASFRFPEFGATVAALERTVETAADPALAAGLDALRALGLSASADNAGVVAFASRARERLPAEFVAARSLVTLVLGMCLARLGEAERALAVLEEAAVLSSSAGRLVTTVIARCNQGLIEVLHGRLHRSLERHRQALDLFSPETAAVLPAASQAWDGLAWFHLERGEPDRALEHALTATRLGQSGEGVSHHVRTLSTLTRVHTARGDFAAARESYGAIERFTRRTGLDIWLLVIEALRVRIDIAEARAGGPPDLLAETERWMERAGLLAGWDRLAERLMPDLPCDYSHLTAAHGLVAAGRAGEALDLLAALREIAEERGWVRSQIEIAALESVARQGLIEGGDTAGDPLEAIARALALARPEGYVQPLADSGPPLARLLALYETAHPGALDDPFGERLRRLVGLAPREERPASPSSSGPKPQGADALSERELEVLRAVASGLSNAEAARRLYLSPFTVKKHLENIYGKLGARNRTEAIAQVRELGLLE
jgi:LuxR family maltose regulon positive regulatory protein